MHKVQIDIFDAKFAEADIQCLSDATMVFTSAKVVAYAEMRQLRMNADLRKLGGYE